MKIILNSVAIVALGLMLLSNSNKILAQDEIESVKIGGQTWMVKNLNIVKFRNGDPIAEAQNDKDWETAGKDGKPAWSYNEEGIKNGEKYGKLYNWYAVNDKRELAPEGWHIPTKMEFETLFKTVGNNSNKLKAQGQGKGAGAGKNDSGFSALLAGIRYLNGGFNDLEATAYFWSASDGTAAAAYYIALYYSDSNIYYRNIYKGLGFSVRCIKD